MHLCSTEVNDVTVYGGGELSEVRPAGTCTLTPANWEKQVQEIRWYRIKLKNIVPLDESLKRTNPIVWYLGENTEENFLRGKTMERPKLTVALFCYLFSTGK